MSEDDNFGTPWDIAANEIAKSFDQSIQWSRDFVTLQWLMDGDTRPLSDWLYSGHIPSLSVRKYLAEMLQPPEGETKRVPFSLITKSRSGRQGRRKSPENTVRDWLIYQNVERNMTEHGPGTYDAAVASVAELDGLETETVRKAHQKIKRIFDVDP